MIKTSTVSLFFLLLLACFRAVPVDAATHQLISPLPKVAGQVVGGTLPEQTAPAYNKRSGRVALSPRFMSLQKSIRTNDVLEIAFFEGEPVLIEVVSFDNNRNGTFTVSGRMPGSDLATFSMTFGAKSLIMTLLDVDRQIVYRLVGNLTTGEGEVVEVDQTRLPVRKAVPAPVPGMPLGGE